MQNWWIHLRDHLKVKLWVAWKLTEIRDPVTKEPAQELAAEEQDFWKGMLCSSQQGEIYLLVTWWMLVKFKDLNG